MAENNVPNIASTVDTGAQKVKNIVGGGDGASNPDLEIKYKNDPRQPGVFELSKYRIEQHAYPSDLLTYQYGGNYCVLYINVSVDSKMVRNKEEQFVDDIDPRDRGDLVAKGYTTTEVAASTGIIGSGIGGVVGLGGTGTGGLVGAGLGVASVAAVASQSPSFTRPQKRLKTAIAMHIPNTLTVQYGVNYSEDDTAGFATGAELGRVLGDTVKQIMDSPSKLAEAKDSIVEGAKKLGPAATALGLNAAPSAVGAAAGLAANPKKEQIFRGVDFRNFTFDYQFYPRSAEEARNVQNIIKTLKYHMHPEFKDTTNFLYIYPSEFDIVYYQGATENPNLHRHTSCVLTNMNVNYTPNGQFTTFADGMPTQINLTLTFKELALLTKDKIKEGM